MKKESKVLFDKAVKFITDFVKKDDLSLVKKIYMPKEVRLKLGEVPPVLGKIEYLGLNEKAKALIHIKISHSTGKGNFVSAVDEAGVLIFKDSLDQRVTENLNLLLIKYKMPHAAYPSCFLIENTFSG